MSTAPARPPVAVVMPFAGSAAEARSALAALDALRLGEGDTVTLADNSGTAPSDDRRVLRADGEHSPARARNRGARVALQRTPAAGWLLFLDADTRPAPDVIDAFLAVPVRDAVGAVAGEIEALPSGSTLAARYGTSRNFLNSATHMAHPFRPRVAAALLLVRREAFLAVGGFREGIRAAEDTDFCWRLADAGWSLEVRPAARAGHAYRSSLSGLRAQWRGYAAGRAWLGREYAGFHPEPALYRALRRAGLGFLPGVGRQAPAQGAAGTRLGSARVNPGTPPRSRREAWEFRLVDILLGIEEIRGFRRSNAAR